MGRPEGNPIALLVASRMAKPKSADETDEERLDALLEEYEKAKDRKGKVRALRAFVRLSHQKPKES